MCLRQRLGKDLRRCAEELVSEDPLALSGDDHLTMDVLDLLPILVLALAPHAILQVLEVVIGQGPTHLSPDDEVTIPLLQEEGLVPDHLEIPLENEMLIMFVGHLLLRNLLTSLRMDGHQDHLLDLDRDLLTFQPGTTGELFVMLEVFYGTA